MPLGVGREEWPLKRPFAIARGTKTHADTVVARLSEKGAKGSKKRPAPLPPIGRGECTPYKRYGETPESVVDQIWALAERDLALAADPAEGRAAVAAALPPGAARNALDCALWDLEAKQTGVRVAERAGLTPPPSTLTAITLGLDAPEAMGADAAQRVAEAGRADPLLKAKFGAGSVEEERARLAAIRAAAPNARLIVDANEGWDAATLAAMDPAMTAADVLFVEQPLPAAEDAALDGLTLGTPLCADESCHTADDLPGLAGRFQIVNVKLDKTGGLTEAIRLRQAALEQGFQVMVGCMVATSLAMAPAYLLTEGALAVDLDGPLLLARDVASPIRYRGVEMFAPDPALWG